MEELINVKLGGDKYTVKLHSFKSDDDLSQRVRENLDWSRIRDKMPSDHLVYLLSINDSEESFRDSFFPGDELYSVISGLPTKHKINQEIIRQSRKNLAEITTRSSEELRIHTPRYLNAFFIGECIGLEDLFEPIKNAAYYLIENPVLTNEIPPEECQIMFAAARGMAGYSKSKPYESLEFLSLLKSKKLVLPYILTGYMNHKSIDIIPFYFDLFNQTNGQNRFVLDSIKRGVDLKFIGRKLKRTFPDYDFQREINTSKPELKDQLIKIFGWIL